MPAFRLVRLSILIVSMAFALAMPAKAAPDADLWPRWQAHEPGSQETIDHSAWDSFLDRYLIVQPKAANLVAYSKVTDGDRTRLDGYITQLSAAQISNYRRDEQFAYWVNLYNALTVQLILDHYPVDSIRDIDISPGLFSDGPWDAELIEVEDTALTLNDIEHRILRPIWQDPRIHYVVNCASIGCPDLAADPYRADRLEQQLDAAARGYINTPRGAEIADGGLVVSKIYSWYQEDFGDSEAGVIRHLRGYAVSPLAEKLAAIERIVDSRYDWLLNDADTAQSSDS